MHWSLGKGSYPGGFYSVYIGGMLWGLSWHLLAYLLVGTYQDWIAPSTQPTDPKVDLHSWPWTCPFAAVPWGLSSGLPPLPGSGLWVLPERLSEIWNEQLPCFRALLSPATHLQAKPKKASETTLLWLSVLSFVYLNLPWIYEKFFLCVFISS